VLLVFNYLFPPLKIIPAQYPDHILIVIARKFVHKHDFIMVKRMSVFDYCRHWKTQDCEQQIQQANQLSNELVILEQKYRQNEIDKQEFRAEFGMKSLQLIQLRRITKENMLKSSQFLFKLDN
jgi:hypothetical protein